MLRQCSVLNKKKKESPPKFTIHTFPLQFLFTATTFNKFSGCCRQNHGPPRREARPDHWKLHRREPGSISNGKQTWGNTGVILFISSLAPNLTQFVLLTYMVLQSLF